MYNHKTYMLDCATRLKAIGHTEAAPKFFRYSSLGHLDELLSSMNDIEFPALGIPDNQDGSLGNAADNAVDTPQYDFCIIKHVDYEDHDARETAKAECKAIGLKIIARLRYDARKMQNGLTFLRFSNVPYQTIGPIGDNCFGVLFSIQVADTANVIYVAADWNLAE